MKLNDAVTSLKQLGFKDADQVEVLNYVIPYCAYLYRVHNGQHQYVWVTSYDGVVVEYVMEVFLVKRNSRAKYNPKIYEQEKSGFRTLHCGLARSMEAVLSQLDVTYLDFQQREEKERQEKERREKEKKEQSK